MGRSIALVKIKGVIHHIRGKQVILDSDLAELYEIEVKKLNQAVTRNIKRFPDDFMFQLAKPEFDSLRSQFVTLKTGRDQHSNHAGIYLYATACNFNRRIETKN